MDVLAFILAGCTGLQGVDLQEHLFVGLLWQTMRYNFVFQGVVAPPVYDVDPVVLTLHIDHDGPSSQS